MIYDELRYYLTNAAAPETVLTVDAAYGVLMQYGVEDVMPIYERIIFEDPNDNDTNTVDVIIGQTNAFIEDLLVQQGLKCTEQVLLSQKIILADALYMLPDYEDKVFLQQTLDSEESDHEIAAILLAVLTPFTEEELMPMFEEVTSEFLDSVRLRMTQVSGSQEDPAVDTSRQVEAYATYKAMLGKPELWADSFFESGAIGLPYKTYLDRFAADADFNTQAPDQVARDLVGIAVLSGDGCAAPLLKVREHLEDLFGDVRVISRINVAVTQLTMKLSNVQA